MTDNNSKIVLIHKSKYDLSPLTTSLVKSGYRVVTARFFAEISNQVNDKEIVAGFAAVGKEDKSGIEFLRSLMIHNPISQRVMLSHTDNSELLRTAINRSHLNYVLDYPPHIQEIEKYTVKIQRRYNLQNKPFQKFDALSEVTEDLLAQNEKFRKEATSDTLTKLYNRRSFDSFMNRYWELWQSKKVVFCLAMLDLDHFKKVNDTYGHTAGDKVLRAVAQAFLNNKRSGIDFLFRYGGEEFALISISTNSNDMKAYVCRLNKIIRELPIKINKNQQINITVSAGICSVDKSTSMQDLIDKADVALYKAKESGRDKVLLFEDPEI